MLRLIFGSYADNVDLVYAELAACQQHPERRFADSGTPPRVLRSDVFLVWGHPASPETQYTLALLMHLTTPRWIRWLRWAWRWARGAFE